MGGPEIFEDGSPHFKQVFFLKMGGPGPMGGHAFHMGGLLFLLFEYFLIGFFSATHWIFNDTLGIFPHRFLLSSSSNMRYDLDLTLFLSVICIRK